MSLARAAEFAARKYDSQAPPMASSESELLFTRTTTERTRPRHYRGERCVFVSDGVQRARWEAVTRVWVTDCQVKSQTSSSSDDSMRTGPLSAKEYVESLHQNSKSTLLYGKNNVIVQPVRGGGRKEGAGALEGGHGFYWKLRYNLFIKWVVVLSWF